MHNQASRVLMIRPISFGFNEQTAESNAFQITPSTAEVASLQDKALEEFDLFSEKLIKSGIDVVIYNDTINPHTPDSIFPNNWISFHENVS